MLTFNIISVTDLPHLLHKSLTNIIAECTHVHSHAYLKPKFFPNFIRQKMQSFDDTKGSIYEKIIGTS